MKPFQIGFLTLDEFRTSAMPWKNTFDLRRELGYILCKNITIWWKLVSGYGMRSSCYEHVLINFELVFFRDPSFQGSRNKTEFETSQNRFVYFGTARIRTHGSPGLWACWLDESLNRVIKNIACTAHRAVFHKRLLAEFRAAEGILSRRGAQRWKQQKPKHIESATNLLPTPPHKGYESAPDPVETTPPISWYRKIWKWHWD